MPIILEQLGSELSFIRAERMTCDWNKTLHLCRLEMVGASHGHQPSEEDALLYDVILKGLQRGTLEGPGGARNRKSSLLA